MSDPRDVERKEIEGCLISFANLASVLILLPISLAAHALVAHLAWSWFAVPFGAPPVSAWSMIGLCIAFRAIMWERLTLGYASPAEAHRRKMMDESATWVYKQFAVHRLCEAFVVGVLWIIKDVCL